MPEGRSCYAAAEQVDYSMCWVGCQGLYADVDFVDPKIGRESNQVYKTLVDVYSLYKRSNIESLDISFDETGPYGKEFSITSRPYTPLRVIQIYLDTATYDEIVKDVSVTLADQLGAIGGTMGLFAGFSFISALEIFYFLMKACFSIARKKCRQN